MDWTRRQDDLQWSFPLNVAFIAGCTDMITKYENAERCVTASVHRKDIFEEVGEIVREVRITGDRSGAQEYCE